MTDVTYPAMRANIVEALRAMADPEHQNRVWLREEYARDGSYDDFTLHINSFDDLQMRDFPERTVGDILRNKEELQAIRAVNDALATLFDRLGYQLSDEEYVNSPEWPQVVKTASAALRVFDDVEDIL
ncbi:hypothetical protein AB5J62_19435 [Amycolatopsis sp. cg5]|uniref:SCO4402 family protein n=1 Tax=Amycolatopsis sp. cg5 TaxID=3238802 RepID=UPI0035247E79